jgi:dihydroflavonol-4-reductase
MSKSYLVTGATGLLGNNVVRLLLERGERVRVLARRQDDRALAGLSLEIVPGDITDPACLVPAMEGIDVVVHSAALVHIGWTRIEEMERINVEGTRNVAQAARTAGARMLHVSSVDALGLGTREVPADEETPFSSEIVPCGYVLTKRAAEGVIQDEILRGLDAVIVNPGYMLGPWDWKPSSGRLILQVARGWLKLAPRGGNDYCDVRDVATGIMTAIERGQTGRRYILGGEPLSFLEAFRLIADIVGVDPPWRNWRWPVRWGMPAWARVQTLLTGKEPEYNGAAFAISELPHHFSYARAAKELGYTLRPAREAVQTAWDWFQDHGYAKNLRANVKAH